MSVLCKLSSLSYFVTAVENGLKHKPQTCYWIHFPLNALILVFALLSPLQQLMATVQKTSLYTFLLAQRRVCKHYSAMGICFEKCVVKD
jgi:hypothetical protein